MQKQQVITDKAKVSLTRKILRLVRENKKLLADRDDARFEAKRQTQQRQLLEAGMKEQADRHHHFGTRPSDWSAGLWVIQCAQNKLKELEGLKKKQEKEARRRRK